MTLPRRSFIFCALLATLIFGTGTFAQNAAPAASMVAGAIKAANVVGTVTKLDKNKAETALKTGDVLTQDNTVITGADSSVVLVFANGATVRVGRESRLEISRFMIDPLEDPLAPAPSNVAAATKELTRASDTNLRLEFGEIVGNVKTLNREAGSKFSISTPAGAAGIRGTTFRIVYRPTGNGQAFNYQLSTSEGIVLFEGTTQVGPASVDVPLGQEISVVAQVDAATNTLVITTPTSLAPISVATGAEIQAATAQIVQTQQQTTFTRVEMQAPAPTPQTIVQPPPPPPLQPPPQTTPGAGAP